MRFTSGAATTCWRVVSTSTFQPGATTCLNLLLRIDTPLRGTAAADTANLLTAVLQRPRNEWCRVSLYERAKQVDRLGLYKLSTVRHPGFTMPTSAALLPRSKTRCKWSGAGPLMGQ